jgi:ABC-type transport system involved in cytochrome c biogenesis permease subunit
VVLLGLAIFIVLAGTLAQTQADIWVVVRDYFRTAIAWIPLQVFFPKSFFPNLPPIPGAFPFPGGWLIGALMAVNLVAAHMVRFTIQARGSKLWSGLAVIAVGLVLTTMVILGGSGSGLQAEPVVSWQQTWTLCKLLLAVGGLALVGIGVLKPGLSAPLRRLSVVIGVLLEAGAVTLFGLGDRVALGDSSMRILWQLIQGGMAGVVLLVGCWMVFGKRGGVVLLHAGIGLLMFSELLVGLSADEAQMHIKEGETVNYVQDIREVELAVIDPSDSQTDRVWSIPQSRLQDPFESTQHWLFTKSFCRKMPEALRNALGAHPADAVITDPALPFDVRVVHYFQNAKLGPVGGEDVKLSNPANRGLGLTSQAVEIPAGTGVKSEAVDDTAAYVEFLKKGTQDSLGTYLLSVTQSRFQDSRFKSGWNDAEVRANTPPFLFKLTEPQTLEVDGKSYRVALRFKRNYKPYQVQLDDVRFDKYIGTNTAKNYSSDVILTEQGTSVPRHIWMNNPLRYGGETFYQSSYFTDPITGEETTGLQVVTNTGWMIPYISCMVVAVGMLFQFGVTLGRFLTRSGTVRSPAGSATVEAIPTHVTRVPRTRSDWIAAAVAVSVCALMLGYATRTKPDPDGFDLAKAGQIPIVYEGRVKPLDTLARNTLQVMSNSDSVTDVKNTSRKLPAIRWILDVMSGASNEGPQGPPRAYEHRVFRIDNPEVLDFFGLEPRKGYLYSRNEVAAKAAEFHKKVDDLREKKRVEEMNVFEKRLVELDRRVRAFTSIEATMHPEALPDAKDPQIRRTIQQRAATIRDDLAAAEERLLKRLPPLAVPVSQGGSDASLQWKPLVSAFTNDFILAKVMEAQPSAPAVDAWRKILDSYAANKPGDFNRAVDDYLSLLSDQAPPDYRANKTQFETRFNAVAPLHAAWTLYILAFIATAIGWLLATIGWGRTFQWGTWVGILVIFAIHTAALYARIYISGRPPVTNLYSSAVFIGWGAVAFGLVLEWIFGLGIGNAVASIAGFMTLYISFKLAGDGDTFTVMQAVLDTQFWLATHVVCISLGYTATFVAGTLGVIYILHGMCTPLATERSRAMQLSMIYGTLCFAIILSFVGTVLGGLWADDSWGRFWGWDPKENGALIIVLWNALVLHARWGGMAKERGLAALAVGGNIATAWSWFGVNELGVGLHSYGFTEGALMWLGLFMASQLLIAALTLLPKRYWWSDKVNLNRTAFRHATMA